MIAFVEKDNRYKNKVKALDIHGKHPYKAYLEIKGNSNLGKYIVVVGDKPICTETIDEIHLKVQVTNTNILRPNMDNKGCFIKYKTVETDILEVGDIEISVYKLLES